MRHMINGYIYDNQAAEVGYQKTGTVPLEEAEMRQVLEHMCSNFFFSAPGTPIRGIAAQPRVCTQSNGQC